MFCLSYFESGKISANVRILLSAPRYPVADYKSLVILPSTSLSTIFIIIRYSEVAIFIDHVFRISRQKAILQGSMSPRCAPRYPTIKSSPGAARTSFHHPLKILITKTIAFITYVFRRSSPEDNRSIPPSLSLPLYQNQYANDFMSARCSKDDPSQDHMEIKNDRQIEAASILISNIEIQSPGSNFDVFVAFKLYIRTSHAEHLRWEVCTTCGISKLLVGQLMWQSEGYLCVRGRRLGVI
jgi:hypothetical protein